MVLNSEIVSYSNPGRRVILINIFLVFVLTAWCAGFLLPLYLPEIAGNNLFYQFFKLCYSHVCHQNEEASFYINGSHILVCARCSGIYLGALVVLILLLFKRTGMNLSLLPLLLFSFPLIIDAVAVRLHIYTYSKFNAFITGILFGSIFIIYIFETIINSLNRSRTDYE